MTIPSFRTALASSVMALVIAFYPGTAIVNADTSTESTAAPQPTTATQPTSTTPALTAEQTPAVTPATAAPTPKLAEPTPTAPSAPAPATTGTSSTETSVAPTQQPAATAPAEPTTPQSVDPVSPASEHTAPPTTGIQENSQGQPNATSNPGPTPATNSPAPVAPPSAPTNISSNSSDASINGTITEKSKSGDAAVTQNTTAGNVTTGNADATANLFNLVQSSANFLNPNNQLKTFTANIQGDVVGDLLLDPGQITSIAPTSNTTSMGSLTVNNQANAAINNTINLDAGSGNATVAENTKVGNTTTGNANAIANVVNMINSTIGAGQSFMGAINIYGNLDGDILLPPGFLDTLLASNNQSTSPTSSALNTSTLASITNNQSISNNIKANAQSGNAVVTDNTRVGNVTTGNALTNLTVLNLSNSDVIGANNLLVFVNVLGKWYGVIMDAPAGTTAASLGGGITQNKSLTQAQDTTTRSTANSAINNDINVRARSGDALVTKNTIAGNATTGNATASVNLANIIGNHLSLSDWFGVLFINVFGTWNGSFGIDTIAGGKGSTSNPAPSGGQQTGQSPTVPIQTHVFKFVPNDVNTSPKTPNNGAPYHLEPVFTGDMEMGQTAYYETEHVPSVLASTVAVKGEPETIFKSAPSEDKKQMASWIMPVAGLTLGALLLLGERVVALRRKEQ